MNNGTKLGPITREYPLGFPVRDDEARKKRLDSVTTGSGQELRIDPNCNTWLAAKEFIKREVESDHMPQLRNKEVGEADTQYARGAMDAFDSLLQFGGEEV